MYFAEVQHSDLFNPIAVFLSRCAQSHQRSGAQHGGAEGVIIPVTNRSGSFLIDQP